MLLAIRRRLQADDGMSLVEVLVALTVATVVMAALAATMTGAFAAILNTETQVRGTAVGNEAVEEMQSIPWDSLALYTGEATSGLGLGPTDTYEGQEVVRLPDVPAGQRDASVPYARQTLVRDGVSYDVRRYVTWVDAPGMGNTRDYKRIVVLLAWNDRDATKTLRTEALRAPTPAEQKGEGFAITFTAVDPADRSVRLNELGQNTVPVVLTVEATRPIPSTATMRLTYTQRSGTPSPKTVYMTNPSGDRKVWVHTISALGVDRFPNGFVAFTAQTADANGRPVVATDSVAFLHDVAIRTFTVNPVPIVVNRTSLRPCGTTTLQAEVQGVLDTDDVRFSWTNPSWGPFTGTAVTRTENGYVFQFVLTTQTFNVGTTNFSVQVSRLRLSDGDGAEDGDGDNDDGDSGQWTSTAYTVSGTSRC